MAESTQQKGKSEGVASSRSDEGRDVKPQDVIPPARAESDPPHNRTYHRDRLVAESQAFFGVDGHVVVGALNRERKQNFTLDEAQDLIEAEAVRPVETD